MAKYNITNFNDFVKILKIQIVKNRMNGDGYVMKEDEFFKMVYNIKVKDVFKLMKKFDLKMLVEEH